MLYVKLFEKGQSLVELLVVIGLSAVLLPAILTGLIASRSGQAQQAQRTQATLLLKEGVEAVRVIKENDWNVFKNFATNQPLHPVISGSSWTLEPGSEAINGLTRQIVISDVSRDSNGVIVTSGGANDPSTKKAITTISWTAPLISSITITAYLTRHVNLAYLETSVADFTPGLSNPSTTGITITDTAGGELTLGGGGAGDWCDPNETPIVKYNLTRQGIPTAISAIYGHAYTTSGYNASGLSLDSQNISNPPFPSLPVVTTGPSYDKYKTYGIFNDASYVYMTTNHPNTTVDIVQIASQPFLQVGTFDASGNDEGSSIFVSGNTGFVTAGSYLYSFDLSSKTGDRPQIQQLTLSGKGNKVVVVENFAYVATAFVSGNNPKGQLQIIDVSNPANMSVKYTVNIGSDLDGVNMFANTSGTFVYLVTTYASGKSNFYIIDVTDKTKQPVIHGSYSTNGMDPTGITAVSGNRVIIVGKGGQPYQVLNISNIDSPQYCMPQGFALSGITEISAIASLVEPDGDAYSYILTNDTSNEFQIIQGGPGGQFAPYGLFESRTFDATVESMFNGITSTITTPPQTTLTYQVAIAHAINNSCDNVSFNFVGPDGTSNTSFGSTGTISASTDGIGYENPGRCFRYRASLNTSDITQAPVLSDVKLNYSP